MEEDDGMESFDINDRDLDFALNPRRHFQSKDQATYGMWADGDSDEEDSRRDRRGGERRAPNYKAPVNFISAGLKVGSSLQDETKPKKDQEDDAPIEINFRKSAFSTAPPAKKAKHTGANVFAGMRVSASSSAPDPEKFADWAKHGKGSVIMNMMKAMGYEHGRGLGKEGQGIVEPVQAAVRPGRAAVGAYGKEVTGPKFGESAAEAQRRAAEEGSFLEGKGEGQDKEKFVPIPKGAWRKNAKVKTVYRTMDDVIKEGGSIGLRAAKQSGEKVVDMTGPEARVYTGYDVMQMKTLRAEDDASRPKQFDIPELSHNLNLLIDLTEDDIRRSNHQLKTLDDQCTALRYDLKLVRGELEKEEDEFERMKQVYELLDKLHKEATSMNEFKTAFRRLRAEYAAEYTLFELDKVAVPCILPQIQKLFARWQPLAEGQADFNLDLLEEWKEILEPAATQHLFRAHSTMIAGGLVDDKLAAFDRLMWEGWMPPMRTAMLRWDPREQMEVMVHLMETWLPIMPPWMRDKVIEQQLIPRITQRVEDWDPLTDAVPIHQWLVPWMSIVGDRLLPVFSPIRQKLAKALRLWNPKDNSALLILTPWRDVWTPATMAAFLQQNIVPKLRKGLQEMNLDPSRNAKYEEFHAALSWMLPEGLISPDVVADLLVEAFFPKWYSTLCFWLDSPSAVVAEVKAWLSEWNGRIPPILMAFPAVKEHLRRGLLALAGQRPPPSTAPSTLLHPPPPPLQPPLPPQSTSSSRAEAQLSLKDVLEITAARQGITYVPQNGRVREGKQVFWFGTQSIFVDRGLVFALDVTLVEWRPISLEDLLRIA